MRESVMMKARILLVSERHGAVESRVLFVLQRFLLVEVLWLWL